MWDIKLNPGNATRVQEIVFTVVLFCWLLVYTCDGAEVRRCGNATANEAN